MRTLPLLIAAVIGLSESRGPRMPYVDQGACPFECCTYRAWTVERDTRILAERSDTAQVVFSVRRGDRVEGITGVVITTKPGQAFVTRATTVGESKLATVAGDILYLLHYVGEGYWKFWFRGAVDEDQIPEQTEHCTDDSGRPVPCAVHIIDKPQTVWWVKIRDRSGREGWTRQVDHFGNIDACGSGMPP